MLRSAAAAVLVAAMAGLGSWIVPRASDALALYEAREDPAALSDLRLRQALDTRRIAAGIDAALAEPDPELARSFVDLADEYGIPVDPDDRARVDEVHVGGGARTLHDFAEGFAVGEPQSASGLAGALAGDVVGYGDLRDLVREGARLTRGDAADEVVLGLAAVGLVITGATLTSAGALLPARAGVSVVKTAYKAGRLSRPLTAGLIHATRQAVDTQALKVALRAVRQLDVSGARKAAALSLRPQALRKLAAFGEDAGTLYRRTGYRGAQQALALAEDGDQLRRAAKLAGAKGSRTRAILKVLGRGALVLGSMISTLVAWIIAAVGYALALAWTLTTLTAWLARSLRPSRRRATA